MKILIAVLQHFITYIHSHTHAHMNAHTESTLATRKQHGWRYLLFESYTPLIVICFANCMSNKMFG